MFNRILFFIFRLVGLMPVRSVKLAGCETVYQISRYYFLFTFLIVILTLTSLYQLMNFTLFQDYQTAVGTFTFRFASATNLCMMHTASIIFLLLAVTQVREKISLFGEIMKVASYLNVKLDQGQFRSSPFLVIFYFLALLAYCYTIFLDQYLETKMFFIYEMLRFILVCIVLEVSEVINNIKVCFYHINNSITDVFTKQQKAIYNQDGKMPDIRKHQLTVTSLCKLHHKVCCIVEKVNDLYKYQLLAVVFFIFSQMIFIPLFITIQRHLALNVHNVMIPINRCLVCLVVLYVLVGSCSQTVHEAERSRAIVSKLMGNQMSQQLKKELIHLHPVLSTFSRLDYLDYFCEKVKGVRQSERMEMFINQLFNYDVQFSACGFFKLHVPLILSMTSTVTTYYTILLQFTNSERKNQQPVSEGIPFNTTITDGNITFSD